MSDAREPADRSTERPASGRASGAAAEEPPDASVESGDQRSRPVPRRPIAILAVSAIEFLEGAGVVGLGAFVGVFTLVGAPDDVTRALALAVFTLLAGAAMMFVGIGLLRRRRWARAPAVVTQALTALVGSSMIQSGLAVIGVPLVVVAAIAVVMLLAPATSRALPHD